MQIDEDCHLHDYDYDELTAHVETQEAEKDDEYMKRCQESLLFHEEYSDYLMNKEAEDVL